MSDSTDDLRYHPIPVGDVLAMDIKDPEFLVDELLVYGSAVIMTGREKSGKGHLSVDLAACIALEEPFCGHGIPHSGRVLYMALEESLRTIRYRFSKRLGKFVDAPIDILPLDGFTDERFKLENPLHLKMLTDLIQANSYVLVILDTLREAHSGRENDSDEMAPLIRPIRDIAHGLGVTMLVTHHQSKGMGQSRGSTAILASFDDEIAFTRSENSSDLAIKGTLRAEGRNLAKHIIHVDFEADTGRWKQGDAAVVMEDPNLRRRILDALDNANAWLTAADLALLVPNVSLKTVQNELSRMMKESPLPFAESGQPKRNNPRKYRSIEQRMDLGKVVNFRHSQDEMPSDWSVINGN